MGKFFGKNKKNNEEYEEEDLILEEPVGDLEYDEERDLYIDEVGNAYTEDEADQFGYFFAENDDDVRIVEEYENQEQVIGEEDDLLEDDLLEDDLTDEELLSLEEDGFDVEELDTDGQDPFDGPEYAEEYHNDDKKFKNIIKASVSMLVIIAISFAFWFFFVRTAEPTDISKNSEFKFDTVEKVLDLMYSNETVEELINKNDTILEYFNESIHPNLDLRDGDIYMARYSEFSNSPTDIEYLFVVENKGEDMIVEYKISNGLDLPSIRLATFKFDEKGIISKFTEDRVYPVIDR